MISMQHVYRFERTDVRDRGIMSSNEVLLNPAMLKKFGCSRNNIPPRGVLCTAAPFLVFNVRALALVSALASITPVSLTLSFLTTYPP
jgi:hypothetical protein